MCIMGEKSLFLPIFFLSQGNALIVMVDTISMFCLVALFLVILIISQLLMKVTYGSVFIKLLLFICCFVCISKVKNHLNVQKKKNPAF